MRDDAFWDGEDGERVAALQRVLAPLREPPRPWGDLHAQVRFGAVLRPRSTAMLRVLAATVAVAAALALGWWWGRRDAPHSAIDRLVAPVPVAEPPASEAEREPEPQKTVVVPMPIAVPIASDKPVARGVRRKMTESVEASVRASAPEDVMRIDALPQTLTTNDIKAGIAPVKAEARACGGKHKAEPGLQVIIKLSIAGATGRVTSAVAQSPHAGTALGRCVAEALRKAQFPRFQRVSLGVVYPVSM